MEAPIHTTQQVRGEHHLTEGTTKAQAPAVQYGSEVSLAPAPVTQPVKGEIRNIGIPTISQTERQVPEGK